MKKLTKILLAASLLFSAAAPAMVDAQDVPRPPVWAEGELRVHDRARGELSPETQVPAQEELMNAITTTTSASRLQSLLEYGERVECMSCVPLLEERLLSDPDQGVREIAAWWLRRRPFAIGAVMVHMRTVLADAAETPVRRARAAEALGGLMDYHAVPHLGAAVMGDSDATVRAAAVRGIALINVPAGLTFLSAALADPDVSVQEAALGSILRVNFFRDHEALMPLLGSDEDHIRRRAASVIGSLRVAEAVPVLAAMLRGDTSESVRVQAAWALGRAGGSDARAALVEVQTAERALGATGSQRVLDAIEIALRMR